MTPRQDPYRVLGLVPGATAGEIRSAYRRLAKMHHPDTAGERSLPRFLAIKAAYEELVDGEGRLRARGWPGRSGRAGPSRPSGSPPNRASREAWRAKRAEGAAEAGESAGSGGTKSDPASARDSASRSGSSAGPGTKAGAGPKAGARGRSGGHARTTERRTARPGSTTYDEATQPLDPSWEGGAWYGASSGSYWTLNPREYADPRKHGPEYQERARRAAQLEAARRAGAAMPPVAGVPQDLGGGATGSTRQPPPSHSSPGRQRASPDSIREPSGSPWAPPSASASPDPLPRHRRAVRRPSGHAGP